MSLISLQRSVLLILMALSFGMLSGATAARPLPGLDIPPCFNQVTTPNPSTSNVLQALSAWSPTDMWAVGSIALHWDGTAWNAVAIPQVGPSQRLRGVTVVSPTNAWAVGDYENGNSQSFTLILHWDGSAWSQVPSPNSGSALNRLNGVKAVNAGDIWAVGWSSNGGGVDASVALHWDGTNWTRIATPSPGSLLNDLQAVAARASNDVWAVGGAGGNGYQTITLHWDGSVWNFISSPSPGTNDILHGVDIVTATDVWAVGEKAPPAVLPQALIEHWNGSTWTEVPAPTVGTTSRLQGVSAVTAGDIWAGGSYYSSNAQTAILHWDGTTWSRIPSVSIGNGDEVNGVLALGGPTNVWTAGNYVDPGAASILSLIERACGPTTPTPTMTATSSTTPSATLTDTRTPTDRATSTPTASTTPTRTLTDVPTGTPIRSSTPTPTPTIGACAGVVWIDQVNTTVIGGYLTKTGGQDGQWDAGAGTSLGILNGPACFRVDTGVTLGAERVFGLTHNEHSPGIDDLDYGIYLGAGGALGVVDQGHFVAGGWGTYAAGDSFQIAIEGAPLVANYYHNGDIFYTSTLPPQLPLLGDASIASRNGSIPPARVCGNGAQATATAIAATQTAVAGTPTVTETPCGRTFTDVHPVDYFAGPVTYLACHSIISGYGDGTFRPYSATTRSQQVKIVVLGFGIPGYTPLPGSYLFADVPPTFPFAPYIETAAHAGIISGYRCGGPGEPCDPLGRPYFRPYTPVTRGQLSKIVVAAAGWRLVSPPAPGTFADVRPGSAFYAFVETAVCHGIISGYACGGAGEPCDPQQRAYFRQYTNATRGQIAKIVFGALTGIATCPVQAPR